MKSIFIFLLSLSIFLCQSPVAFLNSENNSNKNSEHQRILTEQTNIEEARAKLCPFPGYHGLFCPGTQKRMLFQMGDSGPIHMPIGVGISLDITSGSLKFPVLDFTYPDQNKKWVDPISGISFIVPSELQVIGVDPAENQPVAKIFKDEFELSNVWVSATEKGTWLGGEFGEAKQLDKIYDLFFKGGQSTAITQLPTNIYRLQTSQRKLNSFAQYAIDSLPQDYNNVYHEFLDSWGTHIAIDTQLGGMIEKQTVIKDCIWSSPFFTGGFSNEQLEQALKGELTGTVGDAYYTARRKISLDHRFGGNPENVPDWTKTISANPALIKINQFIPWSDVVSDPKKKANLLQAINERITNSKLARDTEFNRVKQERAQALLAPRPAQGIVGHGRRGSISPSFEIGNVVTLAGTAQCPEGLPRPASLQQCNTGTYIHSWNRIELNEPLRFERDNLGRFRSVRCFDLDQATNNCLEHYGPWVDKGCSLLQSSWSNINVPPPDATVVGLICADCVPTQYNTPQGPTFTCLCPGF